MKLQNFVKNDTRNKQKQQEIKDAVAVSYKFL